MLFVFVVDTSCSMQAWVAQAGGMSVLDCAKSGVERFVKTRASVPRQQEDA